MDSNAYLVPRVIFLSRLPLISAVVVSESHPASFHHRTCSQWHDLMHRLMSADGDRFSYFLYWEMFFPSLLQKKIIRGMGWLDSKMLRGFLHRKLQEWDDKTFGPVRHMHNISLWNAEEDCFAMAGAFVSQQWSLDIPMMDVVDFSIWTDAVQTPSLVTPLQRVGKAPAPTQWCIRHISPNR